MVVGDVPSPSIRSVPQRSETSWASRRAMRTPRRFASTNYRSTPRILAVANSSITQNKDQFQKELTAVRSPLEKPSLVPASNAAQEAQFIAQKILALREEGMPLSEMAVLFRAAFHSQTLEFELMKRDIPYEYRGGLKFLRRARERYREPLAYSTKPPRTKSLGCGSWDSSMA